MFEDKIKRLIEENEDEFHDFKLEWYTQNQKAEMIKDLFSFTNTSHHEDCYILIGIRDSDHQVIGVEDDRNRLTTDKLTDYLNNLPIANHYIPNIKVKTVKLDNHEIDVIIIKNTDDVPVYLETEYRPKGCQKVIRQGQIFCRLNDIETPINKTAKDYQVERLWKKRFHLDLPPREIYKARLREIDSWEYFETDKVGFRYIFDPDYCMYLENNDEGRNIVESYSLNQTRIKIDWDTLKLMYHGQVLEEIMVVWLDGARFLTVAPNIGSLETLSERPVYFQYLVADSLDFTIEQFFLNKRENGIGPDSFQKESLLKSIVFFKDKVQKEQICKLLEDNIDAVRRCIIPSSDQLKYANAKLKSELNERQLPSFSTAVEQMCIEQNAAQYINRFIRKNENGI